MYHPTGNMDVDEDLIVASLDNAAAPPVAAPLQLPSGMVHQEEAAATAQPASMHDHVGRRQPRCAPEPSVGLGNVSSHAASPMIYMLWAGASCMWLCTLACSSLVRRTACACPQTPACFATGTNETMLHLFLECPDNAAASDWLVRLVVAISPPRSAAPPSSAAVLLADVRMWQPAGHEASVDHRTALLASGRVVPPLPPRHGPGAARHHP